MEKLIYKELSYKLAGLAFEIYASLGGELKEKIYANAYEELLKRECIKYKRELYYPVKINNKAIGKNFFDFIVEEKIVIEIKRGTKNYVLACRQLNDYLKSSKLKLGLIRFTKDGARIKRIVNLY